MSVGCLHQVHMQRRGVERKRRETIGTRTRWGALLATLGLIVTAACSTSEPLAPSPKAATDQQAPTTSVVPPSTAPPGATTPSPPTTPPPPATNQGAAPSITKQPEGQTIAAGQTATLSVEAVGTAPLTFQWYSGPSGTTAPPIGGATAATWTTAALTASISVWVRVSNGIGTVDSVTSTISVSSPPGVAPVITAQPQNQAITSGQTATLTVVASGTGPLSYQWYLGASGNTSTPMFGGTSPIVTTPALTSTSSFWVRVSSVHGVVDSTAATVTVTVDSSGAAFEDQVLTLVNQRRAAGATCGGTPYPAVSALTMNASLRDAARSHSQDMAAQNYFSHTSLDGRTFDQRIHNAGYSGSFPLGENIAAGQSTPAAVVDGWMASTGHCTNIMNGSFRSIGVGYAFGAGSTYHYYWTQDFGGS